MTDIFKHRWISQEGEAKSSDGSLSESFVLWARKTNDLTDSEWRVGFEELERQVQDYAARGETRFPLTYPEFLGICKPTKSPNGVNSPAYVDFIPEKRLVDLTQQAKDKAKGSSELDLMKGLFK
jgi:hypothetical protein